MGNRLAFASILVLLIAGVFCGSPAAAQAKPKPASKPAIAKKTVKKSVAAKRRRSSPRLRRMRQAFVASTDLKSMARQLLQDRTPAAYAGVEAYARRHAKEDAGALAWLVDGYARTLDNDYSRAVDALSRARPNAGDLGDYVDYYLATSYVQTKRISEAVTILADFEKNHPDSILIRDARVMYGNALLNDGRPQEAVALLTKERLPTRADQEMTLARAYIASGQDALGVGIVRMLYFTMPLSAESVQADTELKRMAATGVKIPTASLDERKIRADLLLKGRRYDDAANEYQSLASAVDPAQRPAMQLAYGVSLRRSDRRREAKRALDSIPGLTSDQEAERLYNLALIARGGNDENGVVKLTDQIRQTAPASPSFEQALLLLGNMYLVKPDYDRAIDAYREMHARFPNGSQGFYAHWKVAWLSLRQGRTAEAKQAFEQQIALYPDSPQVPAALYWRARLAEEDNDPVMARAFYQKVSERFRNFYYGELARRRLKQIKPVEAPAHYALLDHIPPISANRVTGEEAPADNLRVQKARLLANGALIDFAVSELQAAASEEKGHWLAAETARLYQDAGRPDMALRTLKRAVPSYFAVDIPALPRNYWEALFPRPYWTDLKKYSSNNSLDPYLVASLIRQESEFNPAAVSRANAVGLMQLLPKVGKGVARQEKIKHFSPQQLFTPEVNLRLGTRYFRSMVDKFGSFEYALAAYNAGTDRVETWMGYGKYRDPQEFVESIPFTETREYVQAILRNESVYRQLYGTP